MFSVSSEPVLLSEAGLHGLCVSLNAPVLNIEELPVGPARASIALFDGGYATLELALAIRSVETKQVVVYTFQGRISGKKTPIQAMEAASKFAERMGFLFDDDVVSAGSDGRKRAMELWTELTDVPDVPEVLDLEDERPQLSPAIPLVQPDEELVLDEQLLDFDKAAPPLEDEILDDGDAGLSEEIWLEEVPAAVSARRAAAPTQPGDSASDPSESGRSASEDDDLDAIDLDALDVDSLVDPIDPIDLDVSPEPPAAAETPRRVSVSKASRSKSTAAEGASPRASLTKFRQPPPAADGQAVESASAGLSGPPEADSSKGSSQLGRIALVRRNAGAEAAEEKPNLLLRLLSSF